MLAIFTLVCAYSFRHPHFWSLQGNVSTAPSLFPERSPTPDQTFENAYQGHASAGRLIPTILGAFTLDWWAITHSFKEWLLLSQPPSCHGTNTSFAILSGHFGALAVALGSFPLAAGHYRSATASRASCRRYSEFGWGWYGFSPPAPIQSLYPRCIYSRGSTSIDFGENQLSPGLIGLSPLPTSHPSGFQPTPVRASTGCYPSFTLLMGRSPWLRVYAHVLWSPSFQDSLSLRLRWQPA